MYIVALAVIHAHCEFAHRLHIHLHYCGIPRTCYNPKYSAIILRSQACDSWTIKTSAVEIGHFSHNEHYNIQAVSKIETLQVSRMWIVKWNTFTVIGNGILESSHELYDIILLRGQSQDCMKLMAFYPLYPSRTGNTLFSSADVVLVWRRWGELWELGWGTTWGRCLLYS